MNKFQLRLSLILALFVLSFSIFGCGPKADVELNNAEDALQQAREAGAEGTPEYEAAENLINQAKEMMAAGNHKEARALLEEARFKAIEAKGKAINENRLAGLSDEEISELEAGLSQIYPAGSSFGLVDIFFNYDSANITPDSRPVLNENTRIIRSNSGQFKVVVIEGYCDIRGTEEYNLALGQRRAESTKAYLVGLGVPVTMVEAVSRGETEQFAPGTSEFDYQQNRRSHFVPAVSTKF